MRGMIKLRGGVMPLIAAALVFALWNTAYKYAVDGLPVGTVLGVMLLVAAAVLGAFARFRGRLKLTRGQLRKIAVVGIIDPAAGYAAIGAGLSHIDATVSAMLDGTEACFVVAFGAGGGTPGPAGRRG